MLFVVALWITISILIYSNIFWVNINLISVVCNTFIQYNIAPFPLPCAVIIILLEGGAQV